MFLGSDSLEILLNDYTLSYSAPQTISYDLGQDLILDNDFDASRDIIFDIKHIITHETLSNSICPLFSKAILLLSFKLFLSISINPTFKSLPSLYKTTP